MKLIFDIGASRGVFTHACLKRFPRCKIIAVEANPDLMDQLQDRFKYNNVTVLNNIVATSVGEEIPFYICSSDTLSTAKQRWTTHSRFATPLLHTTDTYTAIMSDGTTVPVEDVKSACRWTLTDLPQVKSINLEWLVNKYGTPDLIKIDVEGYELEVILGLSSRQRRICFEFAEEFFHEIEMARMHLQSLGYTEFSFTLGAKNGDESSPPESSYCPWDELVELHDMIQPQRKERWGLIWVR